DLILMDIVMPGKLDGIDAASTIKAELDTPVIFLTASADDKFVERAKNLESFGYITRPFHESELKAAIEVALYKRDLERRLRGAEEALIKEKRFSENIIATIPDSLLVLDKDLRIKRANRTFSETFQTEPERVIGSSIADILGDTDGQLSTTLINRFGAEDMLENFELHHQSEKQGERIFKVTARGIMVAEEREREMVVVLEDITEHERAKEQAKASLREKEVLLEEVHHRVKNNLQLISGLLDMTSMRTHDQPVIDLITDARAKIHIMALIHNQLYRSERFDQIDLGSHVQEMVSYLSKVYTNKEKLIIPVIEHTDVYLSVTQAIPCALALNEVISNAFKHAFPEGQEGRIEVSIQRSADEVISIKVRDDGIGMPEGIDIYKADSLGLKLIRNLVQEQLKGKVQVNRDNGTEFIIEFKILEDEAEDA
ncbi:MAG: response regulator, partial [Methanophagales archaeon]|nr:response regulator [Methanophagales archaeon]